jgi:hypothetical protein
MGRRSRKRPAPPPAERAPAPVEPLAPRPPAAQQLRRRARLEEAPKPPWAPFPLVELVILVGIVLFVLGVIGVGGGSRRVPMLVGGLALVCLASLEVSIREHFAGYRSHTTVLAGTAAVVALAVLFFSHAPRGVMLGAGAAVFAAAFYALRTLFKRRSGGLGFRS